MHLGSKISKMNHLAFFPNLTLVMSFYKILTEQRKKQNFLKITK